jgi:hypothetical protein
MEDHGLGISIIVVWTVTYYFLLSRLYTNKSNDTSNNKLSK